MFRVLLTAYVTLVTLAGPSACCCTTGRAAAEWFAGDPADAGRPACCCRGHAAACEGPKKQSAADADGDRPADEPHKCPCRENKTHAVAEVRKQAAELQQSGSLIPASLEVAVVGAIIAEAPAACPAAQIPNRASHLGSAREILSALQAYLI